MDFDQWASLAVQIPIVVAFILHSTWMTRTFLAHLEASGKLEREQRAAAMSQGLREVEALCKTIEGVVEQLRYLNQAVQIHENNAITRHGILLERIKHGNNVHD